ncbi:TonB-dependent receptor [Novosphingobium sp. ES2-1]|uniref:TonB-dependent receptor n=1 Tax=Novosphingobium sp. ES2-1 TaxID=2780074 RepID=UPI00188209B2|nr:TonB-dependent receptor [Novosphingobium sp. ES2-1]QOV95774.1 TonB-dependent receptor [Novosphingobium sp. ES2-1]
MKSDNTRFALLLGASAIAMQLPGAAMAAEPADAAPQAAEEAPSNEIIVTATRQSQKLQDVAMTVNVATGEQLEKFKIFDVKDVQQLAPGLELTNVSGRNNTTTLRGISFDPDQGTSPAVQVYLNEIPTDAQTVYTAIYDVQQIEVLRGPQGLLRGLSAPAGAITIATRRPSFEKPEGYAQITGTTRAGYNAQMGASLPFSDTFAIRVAALVDGNRLNNVYNVTRKERSKSTTESARITLGWKPTDNFTGYLTYQYLEADNRQFQQVIGAGNTPYSQYFTIPVPGVGDLPALLAGVFVPDTAARSGPALTTDDYASVQDGAFRNINKSHIVNLNLDYDLGPATIAFVGAHQFSRLDIQRDLDVTNALPGYVQYSDVVTPYKVDTAELRLTSNNSEGLGWGLGAFYTKQTGTTVVNQDASQFWYAVSPNAQVNLPFAAIGLPIPGFTPFTLPNTLGIATRVNVPVNNQTWSFNANLRYRSGPLSIEGGVRYSIIKSVQTTQLTLSGAVNSGPTEIIPPALQRNTNKPVTGGVNISYEITPNLNVFAAYGHSLRAGSTGVAVPAGISNDLIRTNPEKSDSFEGGIKGTMFDRRVSYSLSGYYQKIDNFLSRFTDIYYNAPANQPATGFFDFNYNADATIKGVEASFDGRVSDNWDLGVSAAYTKARFDNARVPCTDFAGTGVPNRNGTPKVTGTGNVSYCVANGRLAEVPDFSVTANTELRLPMGSVTPFVRALFTYRPGFDSERAQYTYQSRELLNMFLGVRTDDGKWEFDVFARNLLDQRRITNRGLGNGTVDSLIAGTFNSGFRQVSLTNPREFGATLKFNW